MDVWRVQLKPEPSNGISYDDVLHFCMKNSIIGVGWYLIDTYEDDYYALKNAIENIPEYKGGTTSALKAVNAIRSMQPGDLVWTRVGGDASEYYLCRVGATLWKDRIVTEEHKKHDIGNFVSANWIQVGTEDKVPGKVVNSFCARGAAQHVYDVQEISMYIWNQLSKRNQLSTTQYEVPPITWQQFWNMIGSEELECLVLLYLQKRGYLIYSSTLKRSTAKYEVIMISSDGSHRCFPQVKRETPLIALDYACKMEASGDKVFLFTTSENYGSSQSSQVECITKQDLETFMSHNYEILPTSVRYWLDQIH